MGKGKEKEVISRGEKARWAGARGLVLRRALPMEEPARGRGSRGRGESERRKGRKETEKSPPLGNAEHGSDRETTVGKKKRRRSRKAPERHKEEKGGNNTDQQGASEPSWGKKTDLGLRGTHKG